MLDMYAARRKAAPAKKKIEYAGVILYMLYVLIATAAIIMHKQAISRNSGSSCASPYGAERMFAPTPTVPMPMLNGRTEKNGKPEKDNDNGRRATGSKPMKKISKVHPSVRRLL